MNGKIFSALVTLCLLLLPATAWAAAAPRPAGPPDPVQANKDVREGTQNLDQNVNDAMRNLQKLTKDVNTLHDQAKDAKNKADAAQKAAEADKQSLYTLDRATCLTPAERKALQGIIDDLGKKVADAQAAKDKADATEKNLRQNVDNTVKGVEDRIAQLGKFATQGEAEAVRQAKAAGRTGVTDPSETIPGRNLVDAQNALNKAVEKLNNPGTQENNYQDKGGLANLRDQANRFNPEIRKAREGLDPSDGIKAAEDALKWAKEIMKKPDCPPEGAMAPKTPTETYVAVDNRPTTNVCIAAGQDPQQATATLGLQNAQTVASTPDGTIVQTTTDASTVDKTAKDKGVNLCFASESNFCTIMTPLTKFRGHDHSKHMGPDVHDHQGPDPPFSWGVTPPTTVIRLEAEP